MKLGQIFFIGIFFIFILGLFAWSPWVSSEFAKERIKSSLPSSCQEYDSINQVTSNIPSEEKNLFGRFYYFKTVCETNKYSVRRYFVSFVGSVHEILSQSYWITPTSITDDVNTSINNQGCSPLPRLPKKPMHTTLTNQAKDRIILAFIDDSGIRLRDGKFVSLTGVDITELNVIISKYSLQIERAYNRSEEELDLERQELISRSGRCLPDKNLSYILRNVPERDTEKVIDELNALPIVEYAYSPAPISLP